MTNEQVLQAEIAALKAENEALKHPAKKERSISFKVSKKGACSVYGLGRFPVTLYKSQWMKLFNGVDDIQAFIKANEATLTVKESGATVTDINEGKQAA
jgi:hypothetical protein